MASILAIIANLEATIGILESLDEDAITAAEIDLLPLGQAVDQVAIELSAVENKISETDDEVEEDLDDEDIEEDEEDDID